MDADHCRHHNFKALLRDYATQADLARALDMSPSHVSQIINGFSKLGSRLSREIEDKLGLPRGWLDQMHDCVSEDAAEYCAPVDPRIAKATRDQKALAHMIQTDAARETLGKDFMIALSIVIDRMIQDRKKLIDLGLEQPESTKKGRDRSPHYGAVE